MGKKIWSSSIREILVLTKSAIRMYVHKYMCSYMSADVKCLNYWFQSPRHMQTLLNQLTVVKIGNPVTSFTCL